MGVYLGQRYGHKNLQGERYLQFNTSKPEMSSLLFFQLSARYLHHCFSGLFRHHSASSLKGLFISFFLFIFFFFVCVCVYMWTWVQCPIKKMLDFLEPEKSYPTLVLGMKVGPSGRTVSMGNCWEFSSAPKNVFNCTSWNRKVSKARPLKEVYPGMSEELLWSTYQVKEAEEVRQQLWHVGKDTKWRWHFFLMSCLYWVRHLGETYYVDLSFLT